MDSGANSLNDAAAAAKAGDENAYRMLINSENYSKIMNNVYYELSKTEWSHSVEESCKKILNDNRDIKSIDDLIECTLPIAIREMPDSVKQTLCRDIEELLEKDFVRTK